MDENIRRKNSQHHSAMCNSTIVKNNDQLVHLGPKLYYTVDKFEGEKNAKYLVSCDSKVQP